MFLVEMRKKERCGHVLVHVCLCGFWIVALVFFLVLMCFDI